MDKVTDCQCPEAGEPVTISYSWQLWWGPHQKQLSRSRSSREAGRGPPGTGFACRRTTCRSWPGKEGRGAQLCLIALGFLHEDDYTQTELHPQSHPSFPTPSPAFKHQRQRHHISSDAQSLKHGARSLLHPWGKSQTQRSQRGKEKGASKATGRLLGPKTSRFWPQTPPALQSHPGIHGPFKAPIPDVNILQLTYVLGKMNNAVLM